MSRTFSKAVVIATALAFSAASRRAPAAATAKPGAGKKQASASDVPPPSKSVRLFGGARIPALVFTKKGTLLAFCSAGDNSRGHCQVRRSTDGGKTWGKSILVSPDSRKERVQFASISVVADRNTGKIWCFYNRGTDRWNAKKPPIRFSYSEDDGRTWAKPVRPCDCERFPKDLPSLRSVQGRGIQLENGRLLAPVHTIPRGKKSGPAYLYSDDAGKTWKLSQTVKGRTSVEFCAVQLADGTVYMNGRRPDGSSRGPVRWTALSKDGGVTWSPARNEPQLPGAPCHAGLIRLTGAEQDDRSRVLFSLPANGTPQKRRDLKVWLSYDECRTWKAEDSRVLAEGDVAYSDLVVLPDKSVGCLYESNRPWHSIWFTRFRLEWLTDGKDKVAPRKK